MNTENQKFIQKAIEEILNPTFAVTKQYLEVSAVVFENDVPKIERLDLDFRGNMENQNIHLA